MTRKAAVAVQQSAQAGAAAVPQDAVEALRARLAGGTAREHVVLDFLADDLREARASLAGVSAWLANVERTLASEDAPQDELLALALGGGPIEEVEALGTVLGSVRRRLAQVAARM